MDGTVAENAERQPAVEMPLDVEPVADSSVRRGEALG
jgi:hypothetical protein